MSDLGWLDELAVGAYVEGLRDEGCLADLEVVRRAHALQLLLYTGLSSIPLELLGSPVAPGSRRTARERAATARVVLDLVERTAGDRLA